MNKDNTGKLFTCESSDESENKRAHDEERCDADQSVTSGVRSAVDADEIPCVRDCPCADKKPALPACGPFAQAIPYSLEPRLFHISVGPPSFAKATDGRKGPHSTSLRSGRRESTPGCMTPSHAYYHYTTARFE